MRQGGVQLVSEFAPRIARHLARSEPCVLITVIGTQGSVPREVGAVMVVSPAESAGTIGGGKLEYLAERRARSMLGEEAPRLQFISLALEADSNQCCGGVAVVVLLRIHTADVDVFQQWIEQPQMALSFDRVSGKCKLVHPFGSTTDARLLDEALIMVWYARTHRVLLCGAGHVGKAIAHALGPLPFDVVWWDERPDALPEVHRLDAKELPEAEAGAYWLILTHRHDLDLELCRRAVRSDPAFVGLIGSTSKRRQFARKLRGEGFSEEEINRITCPIGIPEIQGKEPEIIAASVAAQLLSLRPLANVGSGVRESEVERLPEYWL